MMTHVTTITIAILTRLLTLLLLLLPMLFVPTPLNITVRCADWAPKSSNSSHKLLVVLCTVPFGMLASSSCSVGQALLAQALSTLILAMLIFKDLPWTKALESRKAGAGRATLALPVLVEKVGRARDH